MFLQDYLLLITVIAAVLLLVKPLGSYIYKVLDPKAVTFLDPVLKPIEECIYWSCRCDKKEQRWTQYLFSLFCFSLISLVFFSVILAFQYYLPFNPQKLSSPSWDLIFNTAVSFMTNTNWQNYAGEVTLSYFSQMAALTVQNFASPAVGLAAAAVLVRGLARKSQETVGNFWVDLVRIILYLLLPLSIIMATVFLSCGVPQNFRKYVEAKTLEGNTQLIAQGPIASQEAIKIIGSNGGGFTNTNSAHPYENPTPFSNFLQVILILLIPTAQIYYFGKEIGDTAHAFCIIAALMFLYVIGVFGCSFCEYKGNPEWQNLGISPSNWVGKEERFGIFSSALYACTTTVVSCGAVNCSHDSLTPIGGMIPMLNIQLSEVIFGGVGAGLFSVLLYILLAIFISGLIVGRTPEYLGNKIEGYEVKMIVFGLLSYILLVHLFTSWSCSSTWGKEQLGNAGPHGFSEILYAYSSCSANNGSAFAGLNGNTVWYNLTLGLAMLFGRFFILLPVLALGGSFVQKKLHPTTAGSFPVSSFVFIALLVGVILLVGALTFLPALTIGPILEEFYLQKKVLFP